MKDFQSGNIDFDTNKIIAEYAQQEKNYGISGRRFSPDAKHRRGKVLDMASTQVQIAEDLNPVKRNITITGRACSPVQHSRIQKQKNLSSDIGF